MALSYLRAVIIHRLKAISNCQLCNAVKSRHNNRLLKFHLSDRIKTCAIIALPSTGSNNLLHPILFEKPDANITAVIPAVGLFILQTPRNPSVYDT